MIKNKLGGLYVISSDPWWEHIKQCINQGKRALVTGAGQGIGKGVVEALVKCGAQVIAVDKDQKFLDSLKRELATVETVCTDLNDWESTKAALSGKTPIDLLVNSAGIAILEPLTNIKEKSIDLSFGVNVKATINLMQLVANDLLRRKCPGSIVNLSSQGSKAGLLHHTVYCATKGAVDALTRAAALELGPFNIRVNTVNPTVVMTEMGKMAWSDPEKAGPMKSKIPLARFAEVSEVVDVVLFLLSDKSSMITGANIPIDGGFLAT